MSRLDRVMLGCAATLAALAALFVLRPAFVTGPWPFPSTADLSFAFIASILAAAAAAMAWAAVYGERTSFVGIALDMLVTFAPLGAMLMVHPVARGGGPSVVLATCVVMTVGGAVLLRVAWGRPAKDARSTPRLVLVAFVVFAAGLTVVGAQLIMGTPYIFPWPLSRELATLGGLVFLGSATYFAYGVLRPSWSNAGGQLAAFLAYDIVLILPLLLRLPDARGTSRTSLVAYIAVLLVSGVIAAWYLFLDPRTRMGRPGGRPGAPGPGRA